MSNTDNPWKRLGSRIVYSNPWITLREDEVINPNGGKGVYGVLEARVATGIVALTPELDIYLVGQYRYPTGMYSWEIIEGGTEPGEDPLIAAKRELQEEAGLIASSWKRLGGEVHLSNCFSAERAFLYLATDLKEVESTPDETEILQVRRVSFTEALNMLDSGEIVDAMSIMGILRAERMFRGEKR